MPGFQRAAIGCRRALLCGADPIDGDDAALRADKIAAARRDAFDEAVVVAVEAPLRRRGWSGVSRADRNDGAERGRQFCAQVKSKRQRAGVIVENDVA